MDRQILCITRKEPHTTDCTCIQHVGTLESDYMIPVSEVIKRIEKTKDRFYVLDHESKGKVYVHVAQRGDLKYIRTKDNDTSDDKLLKVRDCKVTGRPAYEEASMLIIGIKDLLRSDSKAAEEDSL